MIEGKRISGGHNFTRHLGNYGGYDVFYEDGMLQALWSITVAGKTFRGRHSFQIYAVGGGEVVTLADAYGRGILTADDVAKIHERFGGFSRGQDVQLY